MASFTYPAFQIDQRSNGQAPTFCLFSAPVGEISKWADVDRLGPDAPRGVQREPVPSRISSIRRFFDRDVLNTIPTAIVIAVRGGVLTPRPGCAAHDLVIEVADGVQRPGLIIDGQHRLRGMERFSVDMPAPVVAILDPDDLEMAFQFLVINNKAARVPRDHIRALALNYDAEFLTRRLESARLSLNENLSSVGVMDEDEESPFQGMIAWPNNPKAERIITPSAIETMAGNARAVGFRELEDADTLNAFLFAMWNKVKVEWENVFNKDTHLLEKVGLICLTQYICENLRSWALNPRTPINVGDPEDVSVNTGHVLSTLTPEFFSAKWSSTSYDTRAGRDQVMKALETISYNMNNKEPWYQGVQMIDRSWLEDQLHAAGPAILGD
ncbi:DGQHR domain-containing protein [Sphingomonas faeni]|uniref:DGQHR domain-containing protein n=1 Tax=Sphingomonas faeni TaxID=185950 RepID=UPI00335BDDC6